MITSFSSAGPTDFGWFLKPDISAPGLDVLSSTPPLTTGSTFSVFAGTSMATPHVAGAAALLVQRHPSWTPAQIKSALMSTAGAAWQDTARTQEANVLLEGAGLTNVLAADDPKLFTDPQSLSFQRIDVSTGTQRKSMLLSLTDAGDGAGTWTVSVAPQSQTSGVQVDVQPTVTLGPGGLAFLPVTVTADANAGTGTNDGFIVLSGNGVQRRVPYAFLVERPALRDAPSTPLKEIQAGNTAKGTSKVSVYCCPAEPFGPPPNYTGAPMNEDGSETLYSFEVNQPIVNFGVSVIGASAGALIDPFILGSKDENDVQGYAAIPTDVNSLTFDSGFDVGAAGVQFPRLQRFYVAVDSRADEFTNRSQKGQYVLKAWVDDLVGPAVRILTTRVTAGRPLIAAVAVDPQSGVDPLSLVINYNNALVGASAYDPVSGLILFGIPARGAAVQGREDEPVLQASDYQETKNINTVGDAIYPNSTFAQKKITVVAGPTVSWLAPPAERLRREDGAARRDRRCREEDHARSRSRSTASASVSTSRARRHLLLRLEDRQGWRRAITCSSRRSPTRRAQTAAVGAQDQDLQVARRHRRLVRDRSRGRAGARSAAARSWSGSRARRRRPTSTRRATSPIATPSRRPRRASSSATRASTCSSTTRASPARTNYLDARRRTDRARDRRQLPRLGLDDARVPARARRQARTSSTSSRSRASSPKARTRRRSTRSSPSHGRSRPSSRRAA